MSYRYYGQRRMPVELKVVLWIVGSVLAFVGLMCFTVTSSDNITKDRYCFEAGGKVVENVCMPVDGAIKFPHKD